MDPVNSQSISKADERLDRVHEVEGGLEAALELATERWVDESSDFAVSDNVFSERTDCVRRVQVTSGTSDALDPSGSRKSCRIQNTA